MTHVARAAGVLLSVAFASALPAHAASTCAGFIPATIATPANLVTAVNAAQSANCPGADTIDLAGNTITFTAASFAYGGEDVALPAVTTSIAIINGTITRSSAAGFSLLEVNSGGALTLDNMTVSNGGGGSIASGGAVHLGGSGTLAVTRSSFIGNSAPGYGGGAILANGSGALTVRDSVFRGNVAGDGAAILTQFTTTLLIERTQFLGNTGVGALMLGSSGPAQIRDSLFAGTAGTAVFLMNGTSPAFINTTIAGNDGVAVFSNASVTAHVFRNMLVWGNSESSFWGSPPQEVTFSAAEGYAGATINSGYAVWDFFVNPLVNPTAANTGANYDPALYDWHLRPFSPALDRGETALASTQDLDGQPRVVDDANVADGPVGVVDLGASERQADSCTSFPFPYTVAAGAGASRPLDLRDAIRCANANGSGADTILIAGGPDLVYGRSFASYGGVPTALPQIASDISIIAVDSAVVSRDTAAATPPFRLFSVSPAGHLELQRLVLRNGHAGDELERRGGAVHVSGVLTVSDSSLEDNRASQGGAIGVETTGSLTLDRSTLRGNSANTRGGAIYSDGTIVVRNSTIAGNTAGLNAALVSDGVETTMINTTVSGNTAGGTDAAVLLSGATKRIYNNIFANNEPLDCQSNGSMFNPDGPGPNLIEAISPTLPCGAPANAIAADPQLGALTGSPAYFPLAAASPAVNAGDNARAVGSVDQRGAGFPRIVAGRVDLGSYESEFEPQVVTLQFNAATSSAAEAAGFGTLLRVSTSDGNNTSAAATVNVSVTGGSASAADYSGTGTITVPAGTAHDSLVSIASGLAVVNETLVEPDETVVLSLAAPAGAVLGAQASTTHTINNDDTAAVAMGDASQVEGNAGTSVMTFTATLTAGVQGGLSVDYATADLTAAAADNDYLAAAGTLTFSGAAGESRTFTVTVNGDAKVEANETFHVYFESVVSAVAAGDLAITDTATGTIVDDDSASVTIADVSLVEGNAGQSSMLFTATLNSAVQGGFSVNWATADGTATAADGDYLAAAGTLTFIGAAGETQVLQVAVNGDARVEADETFTVSLSNASNANVDVSGTATGTIVNDDAAALLSAGKRVTQAGTASLPVIYEIVLSNSGAGDQADDPASDELVDALPASLALQSATASAGIVTTAGNTVRWNGALPSGVSVTLQIQAQVVATVAGPISNQAQVAYDSDGDGSNDASGVSDDPGTAASGDATVFTFAGVAPPRPPQMIPALDLRTLWWLALGIGLFGGWILRRQGA